MGRATSLQSRNERIPAGQQASKAEMKESLLSNKPPKQK
jgi:hypothetical protein